MVKGVEEQNLSALEGLLKAESGGPLRISRNHNAMIAFKKHPAGPDGSAYRDLKSPG